MHIFALYSVSHDLCNKGTTSTVKADGSGFCVATLRGLPFLYFYIRLAPVRKGCEKGV